jgi:hypothetical protein
MRNIFLLRAVQEQPKHEGENYDDVIHTFPE